MLQGVTQADKDHTEELKKRTMPLQRNLGKLPLREIGQWEKQGLGLIK